MQDTIFFGNGFNLLSDDSKSWEELLEDLTFKPIIKSIPYTLQYEDIYLSNKLKTFNTDKDYSKEYKLKTQIGEMVSSFSPNDIYKTLATTGVFSYITTNYDKTLHKQLIENGYEEVYRNVLERIYSIRRNYSYRKDKIQEIQIWHIHGDADHPISIMLGYDHYCGAIGKIDSYIKGRYKYPKDKYEKLPSIAERLNGNDKFTYSWIDLFFTNNIHIIGFGLDYSELDIWWILNKRMRFIKDEEININNKIYFYGYVDKDKELLLKNFGVEVFNYKKPNDSNKSNWTNLYIMMLDDLKKNLNKK